MRIIWRALINAVAIAVAAVVVPGITWGNATYGFGDYDKYISLLLTGLVLGVVNAFIRPIIELISAPITCLTLGLFHFVISALMLYLVSLIPALGFGVNGPVAAFLGAIVIAVVGLVLSWILPD
ncbi:MAG TPA: phage holin family protein [Candidatus Limnocylindria bacterium]|jgi:putative membrane protein